ncbi:hypothetical protein [Legionella oakridgensis]|uniref:Uncharacterized protein n=1 Tax=Legionella oakridgensis TaxID=29423 RepID=A0A0W0X5I0_9GAMM|nr:hypothetical protein [Legionella oakridgensis]ETO93434.1 hypothetical protein LOR_46c07710 [Legionella oakridgensis RV-2-2007]KTD39752.1 hypothetical protein Loak_0859 [Legionella oakridgensis]STY19972.1 benzoylformate decarboxylase [Legionella longbeachae]
MGEKISTFLYTGKPSIPHDKQLIQISSSSQQLGFDYPCDLCVVGDIGTTLRQVLVHLDTTAKSAVFTKNEFFTSVEALKKMGKTAEMIHQTCSLFCW